MKNSIPLSRDKGASLCFRTHRHSLHRCNVILDRFIPDRFIPKSLLRADDNSSSTLLIHDENSPNPNPNPKPDVFPTFDLSVSAILAKMAYKSPDELVRRPLNDYVPYHADETLILGLTNSVWDGHPWTTTGGSATLESESRSPSTEKGMTNHNPNPFTNRNDKRIITVLSENAMYIDGIGGVLFGFEGLSCAQAYCWISASPFPSYSRPLQPSQLESLREGEGEASPTHHQVRRKAYVAFRGTQSFLDILTDLDLGLRKLGKRQGVRVHTGFRNQFNVLEPSLTRFLGERSNEFDEIVFLGHSLGGAIATIASVYYGSISNPYLKKVEMSSTRDQHPDYEFIDRCVEAEADAGGRRWGCGKPWDFASVSCAGDDLLEECLTNKSMVCHTFGAPRVGNRAFAHFASRVQENSCKWLPSSTMRSWRVFNESDPIPVFPINPAYVHVFGQSLRISTKENSGRSGGAMYTNENDDPAGESVRERLSYFFVTTSFRSFFEFEFSEILRGHDLNLYIDLLVTITTRRTPALLSWQLHKGN